MAPIIKQQVIIQNGGCYQKEAPKKDNRPRALRQKDTKAIKKKKKAAKMDLSIKDMRAEVDRLEKAADAEEAEVVRKRVKAQELKKAIQEKEEEEEKKEKKDVGGKEAKEGKAMAGAAIVMRTKDKMDTGK